MALVYLSHDFLLTFKGCWGNHTLSTPLLTNANQKLKDVWIKSKSGNAGSLEDVNDDGFDDLVVQILDKDFYDIAGTTTGKITATSYDGMTSFKGEDSICIIQD